MKKHLVALLAVLAVTFAVAAPFLRELPNDEPPDEDELIFISMPAGKQFEQTEGQHALHKMVRTGAAWTDRGDPVAQGGVFSEFPDAKAEDDIHQVYRSMVYFCKPKTALQTSLFVYGKDYKALQSVEVMAIPLNIGPGTAAEVEFNFMCEGLPRKACTAKDCV